MAVTYLRLSRLGKLVVVAVGLIHLGAPGSRASYQDLLVSTLNPTGGSVFQFNPSNGAPLSPPLFAGSPDLSYPRGVTVGPDHNVYVNDISTGLVQKFNGASGAFLGTFASGLNQPYGMAFGPDGNLYVSNFGTNAVLEFKGTTGAPVSLALTGGPALASPTGLAFDAAGNLYVASSGNANGVLEYNGTTGAFVRGFTAGVTQPSGVAVGNGVLYVANGGTGSDSFSMFNAATGASLGTVSDPHLNQPGGLALGLYGKLYVASYANDSVVRFNPDGTFDTVLITGLNGPIYLSTPVPEPASLALLAVGLLGAAGAAVRRRRGRRIGTAESR